MSGLRPARQHKAPDRMDQTGAGQGGIFAKPSDLRGRVLVLRLSP